MFTAVLAQEGDPATGASQLAELITDQIDNEPISLVIERLVSPGISVVLILLVATILSTVLHRTISRLVERMKDPGTTPGRRLRRKAGVVEVEEDLRRAQRAEALGALAKSVTKVVIWTFAVIVSLAQIGVQIAPLIAGAGIVGVAVGFGAQDLVKDFLSGVFMLIEDQYGLGDIVDAGEAIGAVEGISLRSTRIRDVNGTLWHIPNGEIRRVGNMSQDWARALLDVGVAYGTDIDAASDLMERVAVEMAHEEVYAAEFLENPEVWGVEQLGDDAVTIRLVIKVVPGRQWAIMRELRARIKKAFDIAGIEIPFPQRTMWLRTEQPIARGDADAATFTFPVPDEELRRRAIEASRGGGSGRLVGDHDDAVKQAVAAEDGEKLPDPPDADGDEPA